jgi:tetratricopeptide (TPR) repeat protein
MSKKPSAVGYTVVREDIARLFQEANQHHVAGNLALAEVGYRNILKKQKNHFDALHMLAVIGYQTDQMAGSLELFEQAKRSSPTAFDFFVNYGAALRKVKRFEASINAYDKALALKSDQFEALINKGQCLVDLKRHDEAIMVYERATALRPNDAGAWEGLGVASATRGDWQFCVNCFERAIAINPKLVSAHVSLANLYKNKDLLSEALEIFDHALALEPLNPIARIHRSIVLLRMGRLSEGWGGYEGRFWYLDEKIHRAPIPPIYWEGESLEGKSIRVWTEQGIGDEIIYASMMPDLIAQAQSVILYCVPRLVPVFARSFPSITVVERNPDDAMASRTDPADYQTAIASIGRYFRPAIDQFPKANGYLKADSVHANQLRQRYGAKRRVGISWGSKASRSGLVKSSSLTDWLPILKQPDVQFVSLQYGDFADEIAALRANHGIDILTDPTIDPLTDMDGFFAQVSAMDLVISVSNTTVHVAGSLGVETWTMVPRGHAALWYWFLDRSDSPWYPSMRLFRQSVPGQWSDVVEQVSVEFETWLHTRGSA